MWRLSTYLYLLALAILFPAVLLVSWNGYSQYIQAEEAARREVYNLANIATDNAEQFLADGEKLLKGMASRIQSRITISAGCDPLFGEFKTLFPHFSNLSQSTPNGYIVCSSLPQPGDKKTYVGDTQWFKQVYEKQKFIIAQPYQGPVTGRIVSVLAYPIRNEEGEMTGALQLPIDLVNYELMPGAGKLPKSIVITIIDSTGIVVARSQTPEKFIGKNFRGSLAVEYFFKIRDGTVRAFSSEGIERIYAFRPVPGTDWLVVAGIATSEALSASRATAKKNIILSFIGFTCAIAIAFIISKQISAPISNLQETAGKVARGEYERRAYLRGPKELHDVASQFNIMLDAIEENRALQAARELEIYQLAYHDVLTGLPNRRLLVQQINALCEAAQHARRIGAVVYIDLDHFKDINDAYGHQAGDQFLKAVACRLSNLLGEEDVLARIGGDEFVYIAASLADNQEDAAAAALHLGRRIQRTLLHPFDSDGYQTTSCASVGITLFPKIGDTSEILLHEADIAMYQVKQSGRNDVVLFESMMRQQLTMRLGLEADLQKAVTNGHLALHLQPQVDRAGKVTGAEALLRWHHPERGMVSPATFIPLAERSSLIIEIGRWVLYEGCRAQVAAQATYPELSVSINVSPRQFRHPGFLDDVRDAIEETNADPGLLILEVTEGVLIEDADRTIERMNELAAMGVRFSIDDFGTGYSSLAYLKRLPLYELKVDKSFVKDAAHDLNDAAIVESIIGVAKHLGLHVVAEGVETQAQAEFLGTLGCAAMQGYFFARPMPLEDWLRAYGEGAKAALFAATATSEAGSNGSA
jgi:diguanylate cyclase (GGDEF)-like protein